MQVSSTMRDLQADLTGQAGLNPPTPPTKSGSLGLDLDSSSPPSFREAMLKEQIT